MRRSANDEWKESRKTLRKNFKLQIALRAVLTYRMEVVLNIRK